MTPFPDSEALVVRFVATECGVRTSTDLVGWRAGLTRVVVTRSGGVPSISYRVDAPRIDFDVFAATKAEAHDLAQRVRVCVFDMRRASFDGAVVLNVADDTGLSYVPDPDTASPRYVFSLRLAVRPNP